MKDFSQSLASFIRHDIENYNNLENLHPNTPSQWGTPAGGSVTIHTPQTPVINTNRAGFIETIYPGTAARDIMYDGPSPFHVYNSPECFEYLIQRGNPQVRSIFDIAPPSTYSYIQSPATQIPSQYIFVTPQSPSNSNIEISRTSSISSSLIIETITNTKSREIASSLNLDNYQQHQPATTLIDLHFDLDEQSTSNESTEIASYINSDDYQQHQSTPTQIDPPFDSDEPGIYIGSTRSYDGFNSQWLSSIQGIDLSNYLQDDISVSSTVSSEEITHVNKKPKLDFHNLEHFNSNNMAKANESDQGSTSEEEYTDTLIGENDIEFYSEY